MSDLWGRFKAWWNSPSTDLFDVCESMREARQKELRAARIKQARAELRDRFAMAALTGLLADHTMDLQPTEFADLSYQYADAMLKAREK